MWRRGGAVAHRAKLRWDRANIIRDSDGNFLSFIDHVLPTPWVEYTSKKLRPGQPYYHNTETEETTWDHPSPVSVPDDGAAAAATTTAAAAANTHSDDDDAAH